MVKGLKIWGGIFLITSTIIATALSAQNATELPKPRVGVGVLVIREGKILLGKRKGAHGSSTYAPPGGNLEFRETVEACAMRELAEETGLICTEIALGPWTEDVIDNKKHYITLFALATAFEGEPMLLEPHKCEGWEWYDLDNLPSPLFPSVTSFLQANDLKRLNNFASSSKKINPQQTLHSLICEEPWFSLIRDGIKPVEGRKNSPKYQKMQVGDLIDFSNGSEHFKAIITEIRHYTSLEEYLNDVTLEKALPHITSFQDALDIYHQWSTPDEIEQHGFLGIFIQPVK